jgi:hypothetical protein
MSPKLQANGFLPFKKARRLARSLQFKTSAEWKAYLRSPERQLNLPIEPDIAYQDLGWVSWRDFLGIKRKKRVSHRQFLSFEQAREFAHTLRLKSSKEWISYVNKKNNQRPLNIPYAPHVFYANKGWNGWDDWLGNTEYLPFKEARAFIRSLNMTLDEWELYRKSDKRPANIPLLPHYTYAKQGWKSYTDFLGKRKRVEFAGYDQAYEFAKKLNIHPPSAFGWRYYWKSNEKPSNPHIFYRGKGWIDWEYFLS